MLQSSISIITFINRTQSDSASDFNSPVRWDAFNVCDKVKETKAWLDWNQPTFMQTCSIFVSHKTFCDDYSTNRHFITEYFCVCILLQTNYITSHESNVDVLVVAHVCIIGLDVNVNCCKSCHFSYYQIRTALKTAPRVPIKVEVSLPRNSGQYLIATCCISIFFVYLWHSNKCGFYPLALPWHFDELGSISCIQSLSLYFLPLWSMVWRWARRSKSCTETKTSLSMMWSSSKYRCLWTPIR